MPYHIRWSSRKAKCAACEGKIGDMDPRVDLERDDDAPEGEKQAGWRVRRFCLKCGLKRMNQDLSALVQRIREATNVWNLTSRRMKRYRKKQTDQPEAQTISCRFDGCKGKAILLAKDRKSGDLFTCSEQHFWIEE